uniref:Small ribosomal subunit protein bS18c n=2 Tax=Ulva TaxID=3118 RepID=A0A4Y6A6D4_ULVCO|nr:30S ribosomal protein S18 [Ulva mutabilis]YP_009927350.1 30S ribosomal protein S18 [Ulva compressa]ARO34848.1 30S ribosomal protein S18 [Ulva compressa]QDE53715.1 30S ribosomal protein S18 [Ulva mutabilis]QDE53834.1 30S ribosomal protein S18 [Ulva compressa]QPF96231.1 ribosomal protein S18 [Ulva compressa]QVO51008.1 30S ribosomal protein S4 [Ulva compressa]
MRKKYNFKKQIKKTINIPITIYKKNSNKSFVQGTIDYKNLQLLRQFISFEGKILPRYLTGLTAKEQRKIANAIKTARVAGLLPFINQ